jgi:hypothetical protein
MKDAHAFMRVRLATVDAFPSDRSKFVEDSLKAYAELSSTSPDFQERILIADENEKEFYMAYVCF